MPRKTRAPDLTIQPPADEDASSTPGAEEEDPVEAAERAAALGEVVSVPKAHAVALEVVTIPEVDLRTIRGLWAASREIAAIRHYRKLMTPADGPDYDLGAAKREVEAIVAAAPAPEDFELPATDEPPPTLEESIVYPLEADHPRNEAGELIAFPNRPQLQSLPKPPPAPAPLLTGRKVLREVREDRRFALTDEQAQAKGMELANTVSAIVAEKDRHKQVKRELVATLGSLVETEAKLAAEIRDKCEVKAVRVRYTADYDLGVLIETDAETGVVLVEKPLTDHQVPLFAGVPPAPAGGDAAPGDDLPEGDDGEEFDFEDEEDGDATERRDDDEDVSDPPTTHGDD